MSDKKTELVSICKIKQVKEKSLKYNRQIKNAKDVGAIGLDLIGDSAHEEMIVVCLNPRMKINAIHKVALGSVDSCPIDIQGIFKALLLSNSTSFAVVHNHPSGSLLFSKQDKNVARKMHFLAKLLGFKFLDSIIVGDGRSRSMVDVMPLTFIKMANIGIVLDTKENKLVSVPMGLPFPLPPKDKIPQGEN